MICLVQTTEGHDVTPNFYRYLHALNEAGTNITTGDAMTAENGSLYKITNLQVNIASGNVLITVIKSGQHPGFCQKCHTFCYGDCEAA